MRKQFLIVLTVFFATAVCLGACLAVEVPAVTPLEFEGEAANAIWTILAGQGTWGALLFALIGVLYAIFKPVIRAWVQSRLTAAQFDSVTTLYSVAETGALGVKQTYVDAIKAASADGKLTAEEAAEARSRVKQFIIDHFKAHGVDILKDYSHATLDLIIESILGRWGMTGAVAGAAKAVIAPLPDLGPSAPSV